MKQPRKKIIKMKSIKKLMIYLRGVLIGMIAEYCFRVEFGYLQGIILSTLIIAMIIDVVCEEK